MHAVPALSTRSPPSTPHTLSTGCPCPLKRPELNPEMEQLKVALFTQYLEAQEEAYPVRVFSDVHGVTRY